MERGIISGSKEILKSKKISATETDLDYLMTEDMSQDGMDDEARNCRNFKANDNEGNNAREGRESG